MLDLKQDFPNTFRRIWVVGFMENCLLYIELAAGELQPHQALKNKYKRMELHVPFLETDADNIDAKKGEMTLHQLDELRFREQMVMDHE